VTTANQGPLRPSRPRARAARPRCSSRSWRPRRGSAVTCTSHSPAATRCPKGRAASWTADPQGRQVTVAMRDPPSRGCLSHLDEAGIGGRARRSRPSPPPERSRRSLAGRGHGYVGWRRHQVGGRPSTVSATGVVFPRLGNPPVGVGYYETSVRRACRGRELEGHRGLFAGAERRDQARPQPSHGQDPRRTGAQDSLEQGCGQRCVWPRRLGRSRLRWPRWGKCGLSAGDQVWGDTVPQGRGRRGLEWAVVPASVLWTRPQPGSPPRPPLRRGPGPEQHLEAMALA
jgi:hypothetical protein